MSTTSFSRLEISRSLRLTASVAVVTVAAVTATTWMPSSGIRIWLRIDQRIGSQMAGIDQVKRAGYQGRPIIRLRGR